LYNVDFKNEYLLMMLIRDKYVALTGLKNSTIKQITINITLLWSLKTKDMFPLQRGRRLRVNESIRSLVRETTFK
jgi:hypothetical protein